PSGERKDLEPSGDRARATVRAQCRRDGVLRAGDEVSREELEAWLPTETETSKWGKALAKPSCSFKRASVPGEASVPRRFGRRTEKMRGFSCFSRSEQDECPPGMWVLSKKTLSKLPAAKMG